MPPRPAYRRFVRAVVDVAWTWEALRGQVYLWEDKFLARVEKLAAAQDEQGTPEIQRQTARHDAEAVLTEAAKVFGVQPEQVQNRSHQRAYQV